MSNKEHPCLHDVNSPGSTENLHHSESAQCCNDRGSGPTMSNDRSELEGSIVDLAVCSNVQYVMKDGVHGVPHPREQD